MTTTQWQYLEKRPHPWRQQLYIKGRKLRAFTLWMNMIVNEMTPIVKAIANLEAALPLVNQFMPLNQWNY
jgi:hypothetical protein